MHDAFRQLPAEARQLAGRDTVTLALDGGRLRFDVEPLLPGPPASPAKEPEPA